MSERQPSPPPCSFERLRPNELVRDDAYFMAHAFNEALKAWAEDEVPVGAVIAMGDQVIARGHNAVDRLRDATAHAEILAIGAACQAVGDWRLNACTLYVTKEPCPMCSGATIMARLGRVVYGLPDPKMGLLGGATDISQIPTLNHHPKITSGVLEAECRALIQTYFKAKRVG